MIRQLYVNISARLIHFVMRAVNRTLKVKICGLENIKDNALYAVWHQSTFVMFDANPFKNMVVLTAKGSRGDIFTKAVEPYGNKIVRVPYDENKKESAVATVQLLNCLEEGCNIVIAVDGPKGPLFEVKPGIFFLSQRSNKKIIPVGFAASQKITARLRWDKYIIPLPYGKAVIYLDDSYVNDKDPESLKKAMFAAQKKAEEILRNLT
ncbi:MAG: DUF374 domain-containing protein [Candidatus Saganbacteria bacterium]|nr:DUF374 domain-containing protein [Candidatus Saganbacteria bacterium]